MRSCIDFTVINSCKKSMKSAACGVVLIGITLAEMIEIGRAPDLQKALIENAQMLHKGIFISIRDIVKTRRGLELPVRLSRRVVELQKMPYGLSKLPPVQKV